MNELFKSMEKALRHLQVLNEAFLDEKNFAQEEQADYQLYRDTLDRLQPLLQELKIGDQLYNASGRQMILADLYEYIFLGRGYYSLKHKNDKERFIRSILLFVNLLMSYETITVAPKLRKKVLTQLASHVTVVGEEPKYRDLRDYKKEIGIPNSGAPEDLEKYFDSILPKTAGGLWHELLVYIFLLRNDVGFIIPLLLTQRFIGLDKNIIPPDFFVITPDKRLYGIEVGIKKEIQSGAFALQTAIPTATIDTINSRVSDRCPICKKWIQFCDYVIERYSSFDQNIDNYEIRCLQECNKFKKEAIANGSCRFTKYSRKQAKTLQHTMHSFADGRHYHYQCVLNSLDKQERQKLIEANDQIALKTHLPYYSGLEELIPKS